MSSPAVQLPIEDFPRTHPALPEMLALLSGSAVEAVQRLGLGSPAACYRNVIKCIQAQGGSLVLGWMLEWLPGAYVQAMHHAVWRSDAGELLDVTAPQSNVSRDGTTSFVPDDSIPLDTEWPMKITHRYVVLVEDPLIHEYLGLYRENSAIERAGFEELRRDGRYFWIAAGNEIGSNPPDLPLPASFERNAAELKRTHAAMAALRPMIIDRYSRATPPP